MPVIRYEDKNVTRNLTFLDKNLEIERLERLDDDDLQLMEARDNRAQNNENNWRLGKI